MSLDKTKARRERVREQNRALRSQGAAELTEAGPWFSMGRFTFDPASWPGLLESDTPPDTDSWPLTPT